MVYRKHLACLLPAAPARIMRQRSIRAGTENCYSSAVQIGLRRLQSRSIRRRSRRRLPALSRATPGPGPVVPPAAAPERPGGRSVPLCRPFFPIQDPMRLRILAAAAAAVLAAAPHARAQQPVLLDLEAGAVVSDRFRVDSSGAF